MRAWQRPRTGSRPILTSTCMTSAPPDLSMNSSMRGRVLACLKRAHPSARKSCWPAASRD
jgi:hypothetical protein